MLKKYLIVSSGTSKKNGSDYSIGKFIVMTKDNSQFISDKDTKFFNQQLDVGNIITVNEEITY